jgi:hypothetical protein
MPFFPRHTVEWRVHEPAAVRRMSLSLVAMAVLAGVLVRLYRWVLLAYAPSSIWSLLAGIGGGALIVLGLATAHLGNYPVRHWLWRAPLFALVAASAEMATSAALIALGRERLGSDLMHWHDWREDLIRNIALRFAVLCAFAFVLGGVVQIVRRVLLKREHRDHTVQAMHHEHVRQTEAGG